MEFKTWFLQDWGTYSNQTLIAVGLTKSEITSALHRCSAKSSVLDAWEKCKPDFDNADGFVFTENTGCTILWLKAWTGKMEDLFTLVHETNHLIFEILFDKGMSGEEEAQAYQQEYLFRNICAKIDTKFTKWKTKESKNDSRGKSKKSGNRGAAKRRGTRKGNVPAVATKIRNT